MRARRLVLAVAAFALAGGCGAAAEPPGKVASLGDGSTPADQQPAQDNRTDEDKMREFAQCMRDRGVNVELQPAQPGPGGSTGGGGFSIQGGPGEEGKIREANDACGHLLPNGGKPPKLDAEQLDKLREHAKCLRDNGVNVSDPDPNDPGIRIDGGDQEKVDRALKACEHLMAGGEISVRSGGEPK
jgi:hypothetical protein